MRSPLVRWSDRTKREYGDYFRRPGVMLAWFPLLTLMFGWFLFHLIDIWWNNPTVLWGGLAMAFLLPSYYLLVRRLGKNYGPKVEWWLGLGIIPVLIVGAWVFGLTQEVPSEYRGRRDYMYTNGGMGALFIGGILIFLTFAPWVHLKLFENWRRSRRSTGRR